MSGGRPGADRESDRQQSSRIHGHAGPTVYHSDEASRRLQKYSKTSALQKLLQGEQEGDRQLSVQLLQWKNSMQTTGPIILQEIVTIFNFNPNRSNIK